MKRIIILFILFCESAFSFGQFSPDQVADQLVEFENLAEHLRSQLGIPGVGISLVLGEKTHEITLGYSNLKEEVLVSDQTLFSIGSNTKAFTGVLMAKLVEAGELSWEDPIKQHLPYFDLKEDYIERNATIADALSHATGLDRNDSIWKYKSLSRKELISKLKDLNFVKPFRDSYVYNNLMFTAAGMCAEQASEKSWETLIDQQIFQALKLTNSSNRFNEFVNHEHHSKGYHKDGLTEIPPVDMTAVAPAGAIYSSVGDMSRWLFALTQNRSIEGQTFLREESYEYIMSPRNKLSLRNRDELWYYYAGLGGFSKEGKRNLGHSGSIDGQSSKVVIRPDDGFAIAIMTNTNSDYKDLLIEYAEELFLKGEINRQYHREWGLEAIKHSYVIETLLNQNQDAQALTYYKGIDQTDVKPHLEANMNALGYIFLQAERFDDAILVFELNVDHNPNSANAFDSLGQAYLLKGEKSKAKKAYQKSLELNPQNEGAREVLKSLSE